MSRPSSIDLLPTDVREALHEWLRDPAITQTVATERLHDLLDDIGWDQDKPSRHSVNRYDMRMRDVGDRLRQSRQVAEMWIAKLGAGPQGQVGHLVNEILRTLAFDLSMTMQQGEISQEEAPEVAKMLKNMAIAMERLERAASENVKREEEIRKKVQKDAADAAEKVSKSSGMSDDTVQEIRRAILGVRKQ